MRFFASLLVTFALLIGAYHFFSGRIIPPQPDLNWIFQLEENKWGAAEEANSPRILIIGGSEAHYGLSARIFSQETGLPAFNFGTHAALSWQTHAMNTEGLVRPGDIVVFSVNYGLLMEAAPRDLEVHYWRYKAPGRFMEYPVQDWPSFMGADVLGGFLEVPGYYRAKGWMRRANAISPVGDETRNKVVENRTEAEERQIKRTGVSPPFEGDAPGLSQILSLRDAVEAKGGHFYVVFPGQLDRNNYHTDPAYEGNFVAVETLFREHDLKLLNGMEEALLPIDQMYDMIYHPNDAGRTRISRPAAKALARSLKAEGVITRDTMESSS